jgi:hypothetical protein
MDRSRGDDAAVVLANATERSFLKNLLEAGFVLHDAVEVLVPFQLPSHVPSRTQSREAVPGGGLARRVKSVDHGLRNEHAIDEVASIVGQDESAAALFSLGIDVLGGKREAHQVDGFRATEIDAAPVVLEALDEERDHDRELSARSPS